MEMEEKKGWSWLGFFFAPHYYAGYGDIKKGIIYAIIGAFPLFGLIIAIIGGKNARKDLPIGKQDFKWANVALTIFLTIASGFTMTTLINSGDNVNMVKNSVMSFNKTVTVGQAFDNWNDCQKSEWELFETDNETKVVQFTCIRKGVKEYFSKIKNLLPEEKQAEASHLDVISSSQIFQFTINKDSTFQLDNVQGKMVWLDGKKLSSPFNAMEQLKIAYDDEISFNVDEINKMTVGQLDYVLALTKAKAK